MVVVRELVRMVACENLSLLQWWEEGKSHGINGMGGSDGIAAY